MIVAEKEVWRGCQDFPVGVVPPVLLVPTGDLGVVAAEWIQRDREIEVDLVAGQAFERGLHGFFGAHDRVDGLVVVAFLVVVSPETRGKYESHAVVRDFIRKGLPFAVFSQLRDPNGKGSARHRLRQLYSGDSDAAPKPFRYSERLDRLTAIRSRPRQASTLRGV